MSSRKLEKPCIISPLGKTNGYAVKWINRKPQGHHRYVYEQYHNIKLTPEQFVCHHCDERACIEITHLFLGSNEDNMKDMVSKGRQSKGSQKKNVKLTKDEVIQIRDCSNLGETNVELAKQYNVSKSVISQIITYKRWKHV